MTEPIYLGLEDLISLVRAMRTGPVRDIGLLDAATARVRSTVFGVEAYGTLSLKAAALLHSLARNHPLVDGNKRLAWLATVVFLDLNGALPALTEDEAFELVMEVAVGGLEVAEIAERLRVGYA